MVSPPPNYPPIATEPPSTKDVAKDQAAQVAGTAKDQAAQVAGTAKDQAGAVADSAKEQVGNVAGTAKEQASQVAGTVSEQVSQVAGTVSEQAKSLAADTTDQLQTQATAQKERAVSGLRELSSHFGEMAESGSGLAGQLVHEASHRTGSIADYLDGRTPGALIDDLRDFGRRRTGTFLLGAAALGFAGGRLLKGARADDGTTGTGSTGTAGISAGSTGISVPGAGVSAPATGAGIPANDFVDLTVADAPLPTPLATPPTSTDDGAFRE